MSSPPVPKPEKGGHSAEVPGRATEQPDVTTIPSLSEGASVCR